MKTAFNIAAIVLMGLVAAAASADPADVNLSKSSLNVDFNKMIDQGTHNKKAIQQHLDQQIAISDEEVTDKSRVLDFVDVEVGIGEDAPGSVVDRRFDSVGEAQSFDLQMLVPSYKGGS